MNADPAVGALWDHEETVRAWMALDHREGRYGRANRELAEHAEIGSSLRVLDVGAGTGETTRDCLARLGRRGRILCVEPAAAMREAGRRRTDDPRVRWTDHLPTGEDAWDRILCGAAIWQLQPLDRTLGEFARLLRPTGAVVFTIPSAILGETDIPGGGSDPWFTALLAGLSDFAAGRGGMNCGPSPDVWSDPTRPAAGREEGMRTGISTGSPSAPTVDEIEGMLCSAGFTMGERWRFRHRLALREYAAWLRLPPVNEGLMGDVPVEDRARRIEAACSAADVNSWRWERWVGWTAWTR